jgi:CheY-like chemotaxis protein
MTILLVDDERDTRTVARLALRGFGGFTVVEASSGPEALDVMRRGRPDAVVLDVMMPGMDGPDVVAAMREDTSTADLPVIFLTAKAMPDEIARLRELGAVAIFTKPFEPEEFALSVRQVLTTGTARPNAGPASDGNYTAAAGDVDLSMLSRLRGLKSESGGELVDELIDLFASHTPGTLDRLRALCGPGPGAAAEIERLAHAFKGSAATVGAVGLVSLARTIETRARAGSAADLEPLVDEIARQLGPTVERLRRGWASLGTDSPA